MCIIVILLQYRMLRPSSMMVSSVSSVLFKVINNASCFILSHLAYWYLRRLVSGIMGRDYGMV